MIQRFLLITSLLALLPIAACKKGGAGNDNQAIRAAVQQHLVQRSTLNMSAMDMDVKQVSIQGDQATAQVEFRAKQGGPGMLMSYNLQRQGGAWVVTSSRPTGGEMSHPPTDGSMPPSAAPGGAPSGTTELPPSHPPVKKQ
jgi:hypothetical protein